MTDKYMMPSQIGVQEAFEQFVLPGYIPPHPPFKRTDAILCQGSCFAQNVSESLTRAGIPNIYNQFIENGNSPLANAFYFDYALNGIPYAVGHHEQTFPPQFFEKIREIVRNVRALIFTVGVAIYPVVDGHIYFMTKGGVSLKDATWRIMDVASSVQSLNQVITTLRRFNPDLSIILTVSPIPLTRAMHFGSPVVTDCVSKSILRAAVAEIMARGYPDVHYWPSFEAIRWLGGHVGQLYGTDGMDQRT